MSVRWGRGKREILYGDKKQIENGMIGLGERESDATDGRTDVDEADEMKEGRRKEEARRHAGIWQRIPPALCREGSRLLKTRLYRVSESSAGEVHSLSKFSKLKVGESPNLPILRYREPAFSQ